ncbi:MAG: DUF2155 domain-containing protein [Mesorhizobium sp.]|nr:MAG: DUF2155 domain-containing protein [Mesorhizobium sp.]
MSIFSRISLGAAAAATVAVAACTVTVAAAQTPAAPVAAERITNPVAEFAGIDKITGRIITFDVYIDETVQFGALQVTPRICYSRPETEEPKTDSFVEVDEITLDRKIRRIFTGWMFAESPGLNAVEHAVYDVWLKGCKQKSDVPPPEAAKTGASQVDTSKPKAAAAPAATEPDSGEAN